MFGTKSENGYQQVLDGISIKTLVHGEKTLMTEFRLAKGALLTEHTHPHEQTGYLVQGRIKLFIGADAKVMNPGDSWCAPANVSHKAEIMEDSIALEVFSPFREEYAKFMNKEDIS